ncbi:MAG: glycosyltransferase family 4 protein [Alistipes sp.]|nr:glycosyltransferase family 4 protein [Alistipes sp.]
MPRRVLLVTQYFYPENFKCNDIAFELQRRGYEVTVLTAIPNYPKGSYFDGYGLFKRRCEYINGVKVIRGFVVPRGKDSKVLLALNYLSYLVSSCFIALYLALRYRYDAVFVHQVSPVTIGVAATLVKKIQRIPMYFWVLDLWPESLTAAIGLRNKYILGFFSRMVRWFYRNSDKILISSKGFERSICEKGDFASKILYFPNWVDSALTTNADVETPTVPNGFIAMFTGNIGESQDFGTVLKAAERLKDNTDIHFVIVGNGRAKGWVEEQIAKRNLSATVHCVGSYPLEAMPATFAKADVLFAALKDEPIFALTVPAKIQSYMSSGKPIVTMINGEAKGLIESVGCGIAVAAEDDKAFADSILRLANMTLSERIEMGNKGKRFVEKYFDFSTQMTLLEEIINEQGV